MIYHVFANRANIGDWLSAKGIQVALEGNQVIELLCDEPFVNETIDILRSLKPDDFVVIGGGGLFMDYFAEFWEKLLQVDNLAFGIWGVGYCDITHEDSAPPQHLIDEVVRRSRFCFVRDPMTVQYLSKFSMPSPTGCPAVLYFQDPGRSGRGILHIDNYTTVGSRAFAVMDELGRQFAEDTGRSYRHANNQIKAGDEKQLASRLQKYRDADIVLSSALHGCIIGVALGCKVVAVSGDRKIDSFMSSVGLNEWVCSNERLDLLPDLLRKVDSQVWPDEALQHMRAANTKVGERTLDIVQASAIG